MAEVQRHGFDFENRVKKTFFAPFKVSYGSKWDVPAKANILEVVPQEFRNLPVSIKTCKYRSSIALGDVIRQMNVEEDFLLIVGFWKQSGAYKNFVAAEAIKISAHNWKNLFLPITLEELVLLDEIVKNKDLHYSEARKRAKEIKKSFPKAKITLNPKIDSKTQRRLQCSLPFKIFWRDLARKESFETADCSLFGIKIPNPFLSSQRAFKPKPKPD